MKTKSNEDPRERARRGRGRRQDKLEWVERRRETMRKRRKVEEVERDNGKEITDGVGRGSR